MLLNVGHFKASVHKIKAVLMCSSCSNIDANFARVLCLQTVESVFQTLACASRFLKRVLRTSRKRN